MHDLLSLFLEIEKKYTWLQIEYLSAENDEQFMCDGNIGLRHLSKSTYILLVLAQWPNLVPKMTCIIIFLFFQRRISMYESRAIGTTRAFSVELGKHIKRTEYSDVRILCKLESHPINLRHSLRHLNIFSVVAFITVLH